ncbi:FAD:protein FMN transferase [[Pseudomonas] boreopolis]|uniref:FAD:protein FMN transferase n=1 Tax=Xanthomonas boreopolis TaxID=86183 RepID=UPI003DA05515
MSHASLDIATLGGQTMGTTWSVKLVVPRHRDLHPIHAGIQHVLDTVVAQMSTWEPESGISRYNRAPAGSWHRLPGGFRAVMQVALDVARASGGAFDPSVGPLVSLWGFGAHAGARRVPAQDAIDAMRARVGWTRLQWRDDGHELLQPGGLELDLSGIAKGYGVDAVHRHLKEQAIASALVEVGGELHGYGRKPDGQPWRVLVESAPEEDDASGLPPRVLALDDLAIATSGDRWHRFDADGRRYSHTFDPRLGRPVERAAAAVTVIAGDATQADAWATAFTVLGPGPGIALADARGLAVRFLARTHAGVEERMSQAFERLLETHA